MEYGDREMEKMDLCGGWTRILGLFKGKKVFGNDAWMKAGQQGAL